MVKDKEKTYNGSYLYRLNEELSGQQELDPYFLDSSVPEDELFYDETDELDDPDHAYGVDD